MAFAQPSILAASPQLAAGFADVIRQAAQVRGLGAELSGANATLGIPAAAAINRESVRGLSASIRDPQGLVNRNRVRAFVARATPYDSSLRAAIPGLQAATGRDRASATDRLAAYGAGLSNAAALRPANAAALGIDTTDPFVAQRPLAASTLAYIRQNPRIQQLFAASTLMNYDPAQRIAPLSIPLGLFTSAAGTAGNAAPAQTFRDVINNGTNAQVFNGRPQLRSAFNALQYPANIAEYSLAAANLMRAAHPQARYRFQIEIGLQRTRLADNQVVVRRFALPAEGIEVRSDSTVQSLTDAVVSALVRAVNTENIPGSSYDPVQDVMVVLGVKTVLQDGALPQVNRLPAAARVQPMLMPGAALPAGAPALPALHAAAAVRALLSRARIFADFFDVCDLNADQRARFKRLVKVQLPKHVTGNCLAKAFIICAEDDDILPPAARVPANYTLRAHHMQSNMDLLASDPEWQRLTSQQQEYPALELLRRLFEYFNYDGSVCIAFFAGFGVRPPAPMCRISYARQAAEPFSIEVPDDDEILFTDMPDDQRIIVFHKEHAIVSTVAALEKDYLRPLAQDARAREIVYSGTAKPFKLKPVDNTQYRTPDAMPARRRKHNPEKPKFWVGPRQPLGPTHLNNEYWSADFETAACTVCHEKFGVLLHHAVALGVAWGVDTGRCFVGSDCPFQDGGKCTQQFLQWLFDSHHAVRPDSWLFMSEEDRADQHQLVIYFFNGGNFDHYFIQEALIAMHIDFNVINQAGRLMNIKFSNVTIIDFMSVGCGGPSSLDKTYTTYSAWFTPADQRPATGKWKCFPYKLLTHERIDAGAAYVSFDDMNVEEVWGGKSVVDKNANAQWWQANCQWWYDNVDTLGYHPYHHLIDYCLSDCYILQACVQLYLRHVVVGVINTPAGPKSYDMHYRSVVISTASSCREVFCQTTLPRVLESPNMRQSTPITLPNGQTPLRLGEVIRSAYKGGHTQQYSCFLHPNKRGTMKDINSMYPFHMATKAMPIKFLGIEALNGLVIHDPNEFDIDPSNQYVCGFKYDNPNDSGLMLKVANSCLCPNSAPAYYYDPATRDYSLSIHYGCELLEALATGCTLTLEYEVMFDSEPIFTDYVTEMYARKCNAQTPGEVMLFKIFLNALYGKMGEKVGQPRVVAVSATETMSDLITDGATIVGFDTAGVRVDPVTGDATYGCLLVSMVDEDAVGIGDFVAVAGAITAYARSSLLAIIRKCSTLKAVGGGPIHTYYCDTDSVLIDEPDMTDPETAAYFDEIEGPRLGQLKDETAKGVVEYIGLAKKVYCITYIDHNDEVRYKMAHKGIHKGAITRDVFMETALGNDPPVISRGGFQRNNRWGVWEVELPRTLSKGNSTRVFEGSDSIPWSSVEAFVQSREGVDFDAVHDDVVDGDV